MFGSITLPSTSRLNPATESPRLGVGPTYTLRIRDGLKGCNLTVLYGTIMELPLRYSMVCRIRGVLTFGQQNGGLDLSSNILKLPSNILGLRSSLFDNCSCRDPVTAFLSRQA